MINYFKFLSRNYPPRGVGKKTHLTSGFGACVLVRAVFILFFIFTSFNCIAQSSVNKKDSIPIITVNDLLEYAAICYNDSIPLYSDKDVYIWDQKNRISGYNSPGKNDYLHKELTLSGLISWLKKKKL